VVYFVRRERDGLIKIGTTIRLSERLKQIAAKEGCEITLLAVTPGDRKREMALHGQFAHLNVEWEWFEPAEGLLSFIATDAQPWDGVDESDVKTLFTVKGRPSWYAWLKEFSEFLGMSQIETIEHALRNRAAIEFAEPMPARLD